RTRPPVHRPMTRPAQAEIPASHLDLLTQPLTAALTTVSADSQPQSTAVWYLFHGAPLRTSMITSRQKHKNLLRKPVAGTCSSSTRPIRFAPWRSVPTSS
ncbi:pyridoxamine 5'-phosphate oxidase family protein, partial [Frankia sp. Mgl5]|uniref:pyridoxamine 5'-phosphate oxidase family protein n=1 Tax=Frankia sp. Mgl5 TaxID=2933793 RepID=UPI00200DA1B2